MESAQWAVISVVVCHFSIAMAVQLNAVPSSSADTNAPSRP